MGTADKAFSDTDMSTIRDLRRMIRTIGRSDAKKRRDLAKALGRVINNVIFTGEDIASVRGPVLQAIADKVDKDIVNRFTRWENAGKRSSAWPFRAKAKKKAKKKKIR